VKKKMKVRNEEEEEEEEEDEDGELHEGLRWLYLRMRAAWMQSAKVSNSWPLLAYCDTLGLLMPTDPQIRLNNTLWPLRVHSDKKLGAPEGARL
jgi:hypothetical protein